MQKFSPDHFSHLRIYCPSDNSGFSFLGFLAFRISSSAGMKSAQYPPRPTRLWIFSLVASCSRCCLRASSSRISLSINAPMQTKALVRCVRLFFATFASSACLLAMISASRCFSCSSCDSRLFDFALAFMASPWMSSMVPSLLSSSIYRRISSKTRVGRSPTRRT